MRFTAWIVAAAVGGALVAGWAAWAKPKKAKPWRVEARHRLFGFNFFSSVLAEGGPSGAVVVAPLQRVGTHGRVIRFDGAAWSSPGPIAASSGVGPGRLSIGPDPDGSVFALEFTNSLSPGFGLVVARFDGTSWTAPFDVRGADIDGADDWPGGWIAAGPSGKAMVVWHDAGFVRSRHFDGTNWGPVTAAFAGKGQGSLFTPSGYDVARPIAYCSDGTAMLLWIDHDDALGRDSARAARWDGASWSAPIELETDAAPGVQRDLSIASVGMDVVGRAVAVWGRADDPAAAVPGPRAVVARAFDGAVWGAARTFDGYGLSTKPVSVPACDVLAVAADGSALVALDGPPGPAAAYYDGAVWSGAVGLGAPARASVEDVALGAAGAGYVAVSVPTKHDKNTTPYVVRFDGASVVGMDRLAGLGLPRIVASGPGGEDVFAFTVPFPVGPFPRGRLVRFALHDPAR